MIPVLAEPVLLLNANYAPLSVCSTRRALGLYISGKAEMLQNGRGLVQTVSRSFPRPSVIRLGYMVKRPHPRVRLTKREIFRRDQHTCQYCGWKSNHLTIDHVLPRHLGGGHTWENLVAACPECNLKKGGRTIQQSNMKLLRVPQEPSASALYFFGNYLQDNSEWEPYLTGW
jgi:5-methylcytosine-specific restriction endonuclease McrA